jgi:hypothetical protein
MVASPVPLAASAEDPRIPDDGDRRLAHDVAGSPDHRPVPRHETPTHPVGTPRRHMHEALLNLAACIITFRHVLRLC